MVLDGLRIFELILANPILVRKVEGKRPHPAMEIVLNHFHADVWILPD